MDFLLACTGELTIDNPNLWWPYTSAPEGESPGYLYTLEAEAKLRSDDEARDVYRMPVGLRHVAWDEK